MENIKAYWIKYYKSASKRIVDHKNLFPTSREVYIAIGCKLLLESNKWWLLDFREIFEICWHLLVHYFISVNFKSSSYNWNTSAEIISIGQVLQNTLTDRTPQKLVLLHIFTAKVLYGTNSWREIFLNIWIIEILKQKILILFQVCWLKYSVL